MWDFATVAKDIEKLFNLETSANSDKPDMK